MPGRRYGPDFPAFSQGGTVTLELQQWDVLNVAGLAKLETSGNLPDLTGTEIVSNQKVAVFGSHDCYAIGYSACDHLETQLLPVEAWGKQYVAGRMETIAPNQYRVVSGQDGTQITTTPPVAGLNGKTLGRGDWVHVEAAASFVLNATGPVQIVQFIAGSSADGVDPSMTVLVPTQLFRSDYPLLVPTAYDKNYANVVRQGQTPILVNGQQPVVAFKPIADSGWEMANIPVPEGVIELTSDAPFGLIAYGYAEFVSYAYPGGLNGAAPQ